MMLSRPASDRAEAHLQPELPSNRRDNLLNRCSTLAAGRALQGTRPQPLEIVMRWLALCLMALLLLPSSEATATAAKKRPANNPFASAELILQWIDGYRLEADPARLPEAVQSMSRLGLLRDTDTAG